jgi:hypothetical protein
MQIENMELVSDVPSMQKMSGARVKNSKKAAFTAKMCVYFKDTECRAPVCDLSICQKCPEGHGFCQRVSFMRKMVQKVLLFLAVFLIAAELI